MSAPSAEPPPYSQSLRGRGYSDGEAPQQNGRDSKPAPVPVGRIRNLIAHRFATRTVEYDRVAETELRERKLAILRVNPAVRAVCKFRLLEANVRTTIGAECVLQTLMEDLKIPEMSSQMNRRSLRGQLNPISTLPRGFRKWCDGFGCTSPILEVSLSPKMSPVEHSFRREHNGNAPKAKGARPTVKIELPPLAHHWQDSKYDLLLNPVDNNATSLLLGDAMYEHEFCDNSACISREPHLPSLATVSHSGDDNSFTGHTTDDGGSICSDKDSLSSHESVRMEI